ncbi:putative transcription factor interactor and regulator CCHC(Zn) family [Lupinus albus]|uniref:Putative transcription factor interactor and regulator CCHC(Zn) family n=1 Tax=Lupinus albus TaxID=3870 RepID=A0A6A4QW63_LUPAL|nr:putative transcription factor interactor and regulator CCHC(Zn) family [Lupinus albus]
MANTIAVINPINDPTSIYYMNPNEHPGAALVTPPLTGPNYHAWSREMLLALKHKNKFPFIDGTLLKPSKDDPYFNLWDRCNTLILSWLNHSIYKSILQSVLWMDTPYEVWQDMKEMYNQGDVFRICDLQEEIYGANQGNKDISSYYTYLKGLWQELENFRPIATCPSQCDSGLANLIRSHKESDHVIRFLKGLNKPYSTMRSQIMLMDPLPCMNKTFSLLIQQERKLNANTIVEEPKILISNATESSDRTRFKGKGSGYNNNNSLGRSSTFNNGKGSGYKMCTFCNKAGHTVDTCNKKHGFPPNFSKRNSNINVMNSEDDANQNRPGFTRDQHKSILAMLNGPMKNQGSNQITNVDFANPGKRRILIRTLT